MRKIKSAFVNWFNNVREEHFGIIAKKIDDKVKEKLRSEGYLVFDTAGTMRDFKINSLQRTRSSQRKIHSQIDTQR